MDRLYLMEGVVVLGTVLQLEQLQPVAEYGDHAHHSAPVVCAWAWIAGGIRHRMCNVLH